MYTFHGSEIITNFFLESRGRGSEISLYFNLCVALAVATRVKNIPPSFHYIQPSNWKRTVINLYTAISLLSTTSPKSETNTFTQLFREMYGFMHQWFVMNAGKWKLHNSGSRNFNIWLLFWPKSKRHYPWLKDSHLFLDFEHQHQKRTTVLRLSTPMSLTVISRSPIILFKH